MTDRTTVHGLQVATICNTLHRFIEDKVLPGTGIDGRSRLLEGLRRHRGRPGPAQHRPAGRA
jgi:hypothetical protein